MTFLLPQEDSDFLDFPDFDSIPALTCQPDILLRDGISPLKDFDSGDRFLNSSQTGFGKTKPEYIIVKEQRQKLQEQQQESSLKLRLRVATTGSCGSASSSPSEGVSDNDVDVGQFLNLDTDFIAMEESKQVLNQNVSPGTPSSVSDAAETPPQTVRSLSSILSQPSPSNRTTSSTRQSPSIRPSPSPSRRVTQSQPSPSTKPSSSSRPSPSVKKTATKPSSSDQSKNIRKNCSPIKKSKNIKSNCKASPIKTNKELIKTNKELIKTNKVVKSNICSIIPVPRTTLKDHKKEPNKSMYAKTALSGNGLRLQDMFHKSSKRVPKTEAEQAVVVDKSDVKPVTQGSMERGQLTFSTSSPRMFGVRYGPCDTPVQSPDTSRTLPVHNRLKAEVHKPITLTGENVMNNNQKLKINANQRAPKLPTTPPHSGHNNNESSSKSSITVTKVHHSSEKNPPKYRTELSPMILERIASKEKEQLTPSQLPPFKKIKIPVEETRWFEELRKEEQKLRKQEEKQVIPYVAPRPHLSVLHQDNNRPSTSQKIPTPQHILSPPPKLKPAPAAVPGTPVPSDRVDMIKELYFQHHMYCSIDKPLFESDPEALKISEVYQLVLNTYMSLEAQRTAALQDIDKLENLKCQAVKRPYKFIKQLQKGELVFPKRQQVAKLPNINLTYKNKRLDLGSLSDPSEVHSKPRPTEQTYAKLKSWTYDQKDL